MARAPGLRVAVWLAIASTLLPGLAEGQVSIDFSSEASPVVVRFSNPWKPEAAVRETLAARDPEGLASWLRPGGRILNEGSEPALVIFFVQSPVGFPDEAVRLREVERGFSLETASTSVRIGGEERPLWIVGVVPPRSSIALHTWRVIDATRVAEVLIGGVAQVGVVVAAEKGPVDVEVLEFSPLGEDAPDPAERGLLFPVQIYLTGRHHLPADRFSSPDPARREAESGRSELRHEKEEQ